VPPPIVTDFVEPGEGAPQCRTRAHAYITIAAFAVYTLSTAAFAWFARARTAAWTDAVGRQATVAAAHDADHLYVVAARSTWLTIVVGAVTVSVWAGRVVSNARSRGIGVNPRRARWMWFIPLFGIAPSIRELRKAVSGTDYSPHRLGRWLVCLYAVTVLHIFFFMATGTAHTTTPEALAALERESLFATLMFVAYAITTAVAANAILHADRALTVRRRSA
jgi:hypothetical protein